VNFNNKVAASGINARVTTQNGVPATTPPFAAGLVVDSGGTLTYVPASVTSFRAGTAAGYIQPLVVTVPGHEIGTLVTLRMIVFAGTPSDADAITRLNDRSSFGMSNPVTVSLGGGTILPPDLVGLTFVPEPSTIAFGLLGAAALLIRCRKT
jgi:hypothetical protein